MAKYTLVNDHNYILFNGILGSEYEDEAFGFRKSSIKQVKTEDVDGIIFLVHLDDTDSPFSYLDLIDPATGNEFVSLAACRTTFLVWLNEVTDSGNVLLGTWNATTNTPLVASGALWDATNSGLADTIALARSYLVVSTAGNTLIDGEAVWNVGDYLISNGSAWLRIQQSTVIPAVNVIFDNTNIADPAWALITNAQQAIELLESSAVKQLNDLTDVDPMLAPNNGDALVFNTGTGLWEAGSGIGGGAIFLLAVAPVNGTSEVLPPYGDEYGDGLYILEAGATASWVPPGAIVGDVLSRVVNAFALTIAMAGQNPGSYEVQYSTDSLATSKYVWDGSLWSPINAYEPNAALLTINVSNPIGDITSALTGANLKGRSVSRMLDDILFETIYTAPLVPTLSLSSGANVERGSDITGSAVPTYTQRGGGAVSTYSIEAIYGGVVQATLAGAGPGTPNANLDNIDGYNLRANPITAQVSQVRYGVAYAAGPIPTDNKGNAHPADQILSGTLSATSTWTARFPVWYDSQNNAYGVAPADLTNLAIPPIVAESDIRALATSSLFTSNLTSQVSTIHVGDVTVLVALPPGIVMSNSELNVAGSWLDFSDLRSHFITVNVLAADGTTSRAYRVYYARSVAGNSFVTQQDFRFTTTGNVIP